MFARRRSHRGSHSRHRSLRFVAWSCLFRALPLLSTSCSLFFHGLNFLFSASLFKVGLLAILTDVFAFVDILCKRQYLCSRRYRKMIIQADFSLSCQITKQQSTLCPVSRTSLCLLTYGSRCLPHHVCCVLRMYYASCGKLFVALQLFPLPRSRVKRNGIERYLICFLSFSHKGRVRFFSFSQKGRVRFFLSLKRGAVVCFFLSLKRGAVVCFFLSLKRGGAVVFFFLSQQGRG